MYTSPIIVTAFSAAFLGEKLTPLKVTGIAGALLYMAGISSDAILQFIQLLEEKQLSTHNLIFMKGNNVFFEKYWAPFHKDFLHRMYSVSKSFVSIAVGFAEQDGLLSLDDKISKYFPEETKNLTDENMLNQTIRHMLMMSTAKPAEYWFDARTDDRVRFYFENKAENSRPSGTVYEYDSQGYGYLFWRTYENSYFFNGMGCQYAVCVPDKDLIMVYNGDNQGKIMAKKIIFDGFFSMIADRISDTPLPEDAEAQKNLESAISDLKLMEAKGACSSDYSEKINGVEYVMGKNPMGLTKMRVVLGTDSGRLEYTNTQGDKTLNFGNLNITLGFAENGTKLGVYMAKCAEDFLQEYEGFAGGTANHPQGIDIHNP